MGAVICHLLRLITMLVAQKRSADCLDILKRMLVAEPSERISTEQVKTHCWFTEGLPPGTLEMNEYLLQGLSPMDDVRTASLVLTHQPTVGHVPGVDLSSLAKTG